MKEMKTEHVEQVKALKREKTQLESVQCNQLLSEADVCMVQILASSSDNAEAAVLRREILQLKVLCQ